MIKLRIIIIVTILLSACMNEMTNKMDNENLDIDTSINFMKNENLKYDSLTTIYLTKNKIKEKTELIISKTSTLPAPELFKNKLAYQNALIQFSKELKQNETELKNLIYNVVFFSDSLEDFSPE